MHLDLIAIVVKNNRTCPQISQSGIFEIFQSVIFSIFVKE